ncbi:GL15907 [Drosophila persimilis]|uniref:GL15907 n=1 Tax=Drosophila persimilis TaxID=7234 RepID=B4H129_DROPE|nr:GL15907 [Drosophila persimilis]
MHIEIQVALNFVISYLYNKLPRRRVNIFGEELEKALRDKFQGHWYPEKPFKGSAYRCLKTGDAIDSVLERAARESGVPISDILENLPHELSVWMDPGEVSFRVGEKGAVKILYTENNENHEDSRSADREVTKTFNPEAQCFRPIDVVNTTLTNLSLSPKSLPVPMPQAGSSPHSAASGSPTYKGSPNPNASNGSCGSASVARHRFRAQGQTQATTQAPAHGNTSAGGTTSAYLQRAPQAPLTFTTATFAQTKFGQHEAQDQLEAGQQVAATVGAATVGVGVGAGDSSPDNSPIATPPVAAVPNQTAAAVADTAGPDSVSQQQQQPAESSSASTLIDGINSFYGTGSSYQQLLVAN